jgi:hypothetical protein
MRLWVQVPPGALFCQSASFALNLNFSEGKDSLAQNEHFVQTGISTRHSAPKDGTAEHNSLRRRSAQNCIVLRRVQLWKNDQIHARPFVYGSSFPASVCVGRGFFDILERCIPLSTMDAHNPISADVID